MTRLDPAAGQRTPSGRAVNDGGRPLRLVHCTYLIGENSRTLFWDAAMEDVQAAIRAIIWPPGNAEGEFRVFPESGKEQNKGNGVEPIKRAFLETLHARQWRIADRANPELFDAVKYLVSPHERADEALAAMNFSPRVQKSLTANGITTVGQLLALTERELKDLKSFGQVSYAEVQAALMKAQMVLVNTFDYIGVEWETGNVSSGHRSVNRVLRGNQSKPKCIGGMIIAATQRLAQYLTDRVSNYEELSHYFCVWERLGSVWTDLPMVMMGIEQDRDDPSAPRIEKKTDGWAMLTRPTPQ